uniref:Uncharacterized protein n=1 Tax=Anguilla anguilla TaxID=7936 RepID=A0A0E9PB56_ANGAN
MQSSQSNGHIRRTLLRMRLNRSQ